MSGYCVLHLKLGLQVITWEWRAIGLSSGWLLGSLHPIAFVRFHPGAVAKQLGSKQGAIAGHMTVGHTFVLKGKQKALSRSHDRLTNR